VKTIRHGNQTTSAKCFLGVFILFVGGVMFRPAFADPAYDEPTAEQIEFFEKRVRPVLVEHCYECHSGDARRLEAGLRLDTRAAVIAGGDSGPSVIPGDAESSLLIQSVRYELYEMPPRGRLPDETIQDLVQWVQMGAPWPGAMDEAEVVRDKLDWQQRMADHWSWQPIRQVAPPHVRQADWPTNPIDHFILAGLEERDWGPAAAADRRTLIRRLSFDLTGLPPTVEQVEAFVADDSAEAYQRLVDQFLASPHFGEKWARHWMDLVRYAESHGHEFDYAIDHAWRYRDYLIRALNADVPYDQLILEHLAGDLLSEPRRHPTDGFNESVIGTGFWYLGEAVHAPTDVAGDEAIRIENQIDVMTKTFLGLTVACARCHDHKFDPISIDDYYALSGFLKSTRREEKILDPGGQIAQAVDALQELRTEGDRALAAAIDATSLDAERFAAGLLAARDVLAAGAGDDAASPDQAALAAAGQTHGLEIEQIQRWVAALQDPALADLSHPLVAFRRMADALNGRDATWDEQLTLVMTAWEDQAQRAESSRDQSVLFTDFLPGRDDHGWFVEGQAFGSQPTASRQWDAATRSDLPVTPGVMHGGLTSPKLHGVLRSPTFTLDHPAIHYRLNAKNVTIRLIIDGYFMFPFNGLLFGGFELKNIDTEGRFVWKTQANDLRRYMGHRAYIEIIDRGDGFAAVDQIRFSHGPVPTDPPSHLAHRALSDARADSIGGLAQACGTIWSECLEHWRQATADPEHTAMLVWAARHGLIELSAATAECSARMQPVEATLPTPTYVLAATDGNGLDDRVHIRGSHVNLGDPVPRRLLTALGGQAHPSIENGSGRLELARRIVAPDNPFPARVLVNRLWHHLFGRGIVPTVDDFGVMGQPPTHGELLDWLAADFQQHGWSIKHAIRQMVMSSTYRMSSQATADQVRATERDPANQWLYRMSKRRLQAESIRDAMLAVSGRLDPAMYGPSVPVHLTAFMEGRGRPQGGPLDGNGRRSVYISLRRNFLSPMMLAFDMPSPFSTMGRRSDSNVPAQSLILMNDPFVISQAQQWAQRVLDEHVSAELRIEAMFHQAFSKPPTTDQLDRIRQFLAQQAERYGASEDDLRIWTDLAHVLFNMKEFIYLN
jgi:hypothetical protein